MKATKTINVTVTMTLEELREFRSALHDASSYWYKHMVAAEDAVKDGKEPTVSPSGARLVYQERLRMYSQITDTYNELIEED